MQNHLISLATANCVPSFGENCRCNKRVRRSSKPRGAMPSASSLGFGKKRAYNGFQALVIIRNYKTAFLNSCSRNVQKQVSALPGGVYNHSSDVFLQESARPIVTPCLLP